MALNSLLCADVPLRTYTLTHSRLPTATLHALVNHQSLHTVLQFSLFKTDQTFTQGAFVAIFG